MKSSLKWLLRLGAGIIELINWRKRRQHREELRKPQQEAEEAVEEVRTGDEAAVNARLQDIMRPRCGGGTTGAVDWRVPVALAVVALALSFGCVRIKTKVVRVPANQHVVHLVVEGQDGYFVPTDMMEAMMYRLTLYSYESDLRERTLDRLCNVVPPEDAVSEP